MAEVRELEEDLPLIVRFNGVKGVRVGPDGVSGTFPDECIPATTDAAVAVGAPITPFLVASPAEAVDPIEEADIETERLNCVADAGAKGTAAVAVPVLLSPTETERLRLTGAGRGTSDADEDFNGSSKQGGGKTGLVDALPVPEGPPPPTLRRVPNPDFSINA